jgi:hypothetical protein
METSLIQRKRQERPTSDQSKSLMLRKRLPIGGPSFVVRNVARWRPLVVQSTRRRTGPRELSRVPLRGFAHYLMSHSLYCSG